MKVSPKFAAILVALCGLLLYQSIMNQRSIHQANTLTKSLEVHLDSLQRITAHYQQIHQSYRDLHVRLLLSQHHMGDLNRELTRISNQRQDDVDEIHDHLRDILAAYDTLQLRPLPTSPNTEILIQ